MHLGLMVLECIDLHCDTLTTALDKGLPLKNKETNFDFKFAEKCDRYVQNFAIWTKEKEQNKREYLENVYKFALEQFSQNKIDIITNQADFNAKGKGVSALLSVEGCDFAESIEDVDWLYEKGFRVMSLCWNGKNKLAAGCNAVGGLTYFGRDFINRMNKLKIPCDLSHLNEQSFFEVAECADKVLATHSNIREIKNHSRNLNKDMLNVIKDKKGVIGLCFYPMFLKGDIYMSLLENVYYLLTFGMEDCICLGSDFDGGEMDKKLSKTGDFLSLYNFFCEKIGSKSIVDKIFYRNAEKFIKEALTKG